jgi:hypothetical protein
MPRPLLTVMILGLFAAAQRSWADEKSGGPLMLATAKRVVFLCDASESMKDKLDALGPQTVSAVNALRADQSFTVIFMCGGAMLTLGKDSLPATDENKRKMETLLPMVKPRGGSLSVAGFRTAFAAKPDLILFVSDGNFADGDKVVNEIRTLNKQSHAVIQTIALFPKGEANTKVLKQIAAENLGTFKSVSRSDLKP